MVKIITDTSALFTVEQGEAMGLKVLPLCVAAGDQQFRDLCFDVNIFYDLIAKGNIPSSSQPPIGEVLEAFEACKGEEIINICMADGLSGTYQSALSAKSQASNGDDIIVLNSQTLCGPQRYLVEKAMKLTKTCKSAKEIINKLQDSIEHCGSFLIPQDFGFLKRGGRLKPAAAVVGGFLKLKPVMMQVDEGKRLDKFTISRTLTSAINAMSDHFKKLELNDNYRIYISHADALDSAKLIMDRLKQTFNECEFEMLELSPAFITQGGPHCIAIQYIKK
ncbi:MAG: DegV family protein [Erysipelotrichaceae bacterium]